jgi:hypothetical protein
MIMQKNKLYKKTILIVLLLFISFSCKKQNEDLSSIENICKKVAQCDKEFQKFKDIDKYCISFFVKLKKNKFSSLNKIIECLNDTPCESLSFQECTIEYVKELQNMKPASKND